jgi:hypothetical protein
MVEKDIIRDEKRMVDYKLGRVLGSGGFGKCFMATRMTDNAEFACKIIIYEKMGRKMSKQQLLR